MSRLGAFLTSLINKIIQATDKVFKIVLIIIALVFLKCCYDYSQNGHYTIVSSSESRRVYLLDTRDGTVFISGKSYDAVTDESWRKIKPTKDQKAVQEQP